MENSLLEVNPGILEAAEAMGASTWQVIRYFLLPETLGSIVLALTTGTIGLLGASAMAGYVGGGGVGDLALTYGYQRMNTPLMIFTVVVLVIFVQILQLAGNAVSRKLRHLNSVVLPEPDEPIIASTSPFLREKLISFKTSVLP